MHFVQGIRNASSIALLAACALAQAKARDVKANVARLAAEDARAADVFQALDASLQREVVEYFTLEASRLNTFQASLVVHMLEGQERDAGLWPPRGALPVFDPNEHAPAQPIARRAVDPTSGSAAAFRTRIFAKQPAPAFESAWTYDYASRGLVHERTLADPARIFRNGLRGFPPDLDLCVALVERALDDGGEQLALTAFGHAYTDRDGRAYGDISLYDAWSAGIEIEMPDVDTLGIVHTVLRDFESWVAPVSGGEQDALYAKIGEVYKSAHRHRSLRHALAHTYLVGSAVLRDGYTNQLDGFHALWESCRSIPGDLAPKLPASKDWTKFLEGWARRCRSDAKLARAGVNRRLVLDRDGLQVRAALLRVLDELTAFDVLRDESPPPAVGKRGRRDEKPH